MRERMEDGDLTGFFPIINDLLVRQRGVEGAVDPEDVVEESDPNVQRMDHQFEFHAHEAVMQDVVLEPERFGGGSAKGRGARCVLVVCQVFLI